MSVHRIMEIDAARRRLAALPGRARTQMRAALLRIGDQVVAQARQALQSQRRPAPSCEEPDVSQGSIEASLTASLDPDSDTLTVSSSSPHALFVEYGTWHRAARPFLRPAAEAARAAALEEARAAVVRATQEDA